MSLFSKLFGKKKKHHHPAASVSPTYDNQPPLKSCNACQPGGCETCPCTENADCEHSDSLAHDPEDE